jgi:hypothetical protein
MGRTLNGLRKMLDVIRYSELIKRKYISEVKDLEKHLDVLIGAPSLKEFAN